MQTSNNFSSVNHMELPPNKQKQCQNEWKQAQGNETDPYPIANDIF